MVMSYDFGKRHRKQSGHGRAGAYRRTSPGDMSAEIGYALSDHARESPSGLHVKISSMSSDPGGNAPSGLYFQVRPECSPLFGTI